MTNQPHLTADMAGCSHQPSPGIFPYFYYMNDNLQLQLKTLPEEPGVYRYYDRNDHLLYVGKAKNLKKRVMSYFNKNQNGYRTRIMVSKIHRLETTIVPSEYDALLLENNLIKEHQPQYNIMLQLEVAPLQYTVYITIEPGDS